MSGKRAKARRRASGVIRDGGGVRLRRRTPASLALDRRDGRRCGVGPLVGGGRLGLAGRRRGRQRLGYDRAAHPEQHGRATGQLATDPQLARLQHRTGTRCPVRPALQLGGGIEWGHGAGPEPDLRLPPRERPHFPDESQWGAVRPLGACRGGLSPRHDAPDHGSRLPDGEVPLHAERDSPACSRS